MSKRGIDEVTSGTGSNEVSGSKRRKIRSCLTCRKQKARCEFTTSVDVCHRCTVLKIPCTFEPDAHANLFSTAGSTGQASTSRNVQPRVERLSHRGPEKDASESHSDPSIEGRLSVIEEALKQVLRATGLPSLENISTTLVSHPFSSYSRPSHNARHTTPGDSANDLPQRGRSLYKTPVDLGYITLAQSTELTSIFEMRYNHCVYTPILKSRRMTLERPFTFTVMCALALRLKTTISSQVQHQVVRLVESHLRLAMGARPHSIDAIHALLLMSLWSSALVSNGTEQDDSIIPDGWLLLSTTIRMAQNLRLDQATAEVYLLIQQNKVGSEDYETALEKARVWYTLVTYDLAMSVGPVRPRLVVSPDTSQSRILVNSFASSPLDQCLAYHLDALILVHKVYEVPPPLVSSQIPQFVLQIDSILDDLEALANAAKESSAMNENKQALSMEYRMFHIYEQYCECVCLSKACEIISSPPFEPPPCSEDGGSDSEEDEDLATTGTMVFLWLARLCSLAENVINEAFPSNSGEATFLSTAPDHMFTIIAFCSGTLIQSQVTALKFCSDGLGQEGEKDSLVARASQSLAGLVLPDSQLPRRYAQALSTMLDKWKARKHDIASRKYERLQRRSRDGNAPASDIDPVNGGDLLALAIASTEGEEEQLQRNSQTEHSVPSIRETSSFLDPSTWLQDQLLDLDPYSLRQA